MARPRLESRVQGVVVHTEIDAPASDGSAGASRMGKRRYRLRASVGSEPRAPPRAGGPSLPLAPQLDGKAVPVPAGPAWHAVAGHRAEAGEHVLERARLDVMDPRTSVCGRGPLVEDPQRRALTELQAPTEHGGLLQEREDAPLELREANLRVDRLESHLASSSGTQNAPSLAGTRGLPRGTTPLPAASPG